MLKLLGNFFSRKVFFQFFFPLKETKECDRIFAKISIVQNGILKINKLFNKHVSKVLLRYSFTYPLKVEMGIWMGPEDSHANIMCPTQSIVDSVHIVCMCGEMQVVPQYVRQPLPFVSFSLPFLVLSFL